MVIIKFRDGGDKAYVEIVCRFEDVHAVAWALEHSATVLQFTVESNEGDMPKDFGFAPMSKWVFIFNYS